MTALVLALWSAAASLSRAEPPSTPVEANAYATSAQLSEIRAYIRQAWSMLTRSPASLVRAAADPKFLAKSEKPVVYVPSEEDVLTVPKRLQQTVPAEELTRIRFKPLPAGGVIPAPGLLYLPNPYVVPGGRFNEMYGWDSYFILVGLLRDGELALAKGMTDNFLYEVLHYGKVLNANRTYYLTRSQPPFLTEMVLLTYKKTGDKAWLKNAVPAMETYYFYWTRGDHVTKDGLSRYFDSGHGPAPEVVSSERDAKGLTHYDRVAEHLKTHTIPDFQTNKFYDANSGRLTPLFYRNDRSMRESGFNPSDRFGPFNAEVLDTTPVCLNSLLYRTETGMEEIQTILGNPTAASVWAARAKKRRSFVNAFMWDDKDGLYYDFNHETRKPRRYPFVTTFYPLWAGIAEPKQAKRVRGNLRLFERRGGLMTSTNSSGQQWDAPFGWAPMQMIAIEGLRRYGFNEDADRISVNFLSMVLAEFVEHHAIKARYDVVTRKSDLPAGIRFGYESNEIGFGWTNAAFEELYEMLPEAERAKVLDLRGRNPGR
ncbi:MAG: alpha,alpha-trehalase [Elusimicrobia bacterium]|nr:alpha,alpha-trehalase [Elusimicrobiota bacterium]